MKCNICNKEFNKRLGSHIPTHNITIKEYYDLYIRKENEGICPICGKENKFLGLTKGYSAHCSIKCKDLDINVKIKANNTCLQRYGAINVYASEYGKQKIKNTLLERYGVENPQQNIEIKNRTKQTFIDRYNGIGSGSSIIKEKVKQTNIIKRNVEYSFQSSDVQEKIKQTNLQRYGVKNQWQRHELREKALSEEAYRKRNETMFKNGNSSSSEDRCYDIIKSIFPSVKRPYKSEQYPYLCDFYIPELDLYIECHFFWTHGGHFFNKNNPEDLATIEEWKSRHTNFYDSAIQNWTVRDIEKLECAHRNNLNYLVCWTEEEFMSIFNRDFSKHDDLLNKIKNVTQVAKLANWNEYFKREIE